MRGFIFFINHFFLRLAPNALSPRDARAVFGFKFFSSMCPRDMRAFGPEAALLSFLVRVLDKIAQAQEGVDMRERGDSPFSSC